MEKIKHSEGQELIMKVRRGEEDLTLSVRPEVSQSGDYKIGVWIRDNEIGRAHV